MAEWGKRCGGFVYDVSSKVRGESAGDSEEWGREEVGSAGMGSTRWGKWGGSTGQG